MAASTTRRRFVLGAATAPFVASSAVAEPQFPWRTIRIVIGFPPGGGIDILARLMAPRMAERLGHPVIVENRAGANGLIAAQNVAQSEADGHTILFGTLGNLAINPVFYGAHAGFDWERDFTPLSYIASLPFLLVVNPALPVKSMRELIDLAKARPGELFFGSSGNGGLPHLCGELFNLQAGVRTVHVPYRGSVPAFTDLVSGQVQFSFDAYAIAQPFIDGGRLRPLAITGPQRMAALPDVPLTKDTLPNFEVVNWYGMVLRAGPSPAVVSRLHEEVVRALHEPEVVERAVSLGLDLVGTTPEEFAAFQRTEVAKWGEVIRTAKIQIE
jgi:tripartite-type tricarboxylate transporter receptor subunit TctC